MRKFIAILMIAVFMLYGTASVYADNGDIKITAEIGFNKVYRAGYITPVVITVENNQKDIDGEIQIEIPSSMGPMGVDAVNLYAIGINHPQNTVKKYTMNIPIPSSMLNTKVRITEGKKTLTEQYVRIDMGISENMMLAGILSDNPSALSYLNGFTFKTFRGSSTMKIADLNEASFPVDRDVLKSFNVIIINDYESFKLSQDQYKALKDWVNDGGFLILGTGPNNKTLSIFKDDFITGEKGQLTKVTAKGLGAVAGDGFSEIIEVLDIKTQGGESLISQNGIDLVQQIDKGKGRVLLLSFDLGLEPISSWKLNRYFMEALLQRAAPSVYSSQDLEKYIVIGQQHEYSMDRALKNIPELPMPGYKTILILFAIYILLAAPISYIILKRKDKREFVWVVVPALSLVFAAIIYFAGFGTRLTGPVFNKISIIYGDRFGALTSKSFGGVFTPGKADIKVEGIDGTKLRPLVNRSYFNSSYPNWEDRKLDTKITLYPKASVEFYDTGVWSMKTLALSGSEHAEGSIIGQISYKDFSFSGFVENSADFDLEECYLISSYQYMALGDIKRGERLEIAGEAKKYYGNRYDLMDSLYSRNIRRNNRQNLTDAEIAQLRKDNQRRDIFEYFFSGDSQGIEGIKLIGWTKAPVGGQVKVNGKNVKNFEKSLVVTEMNLVTQPEGELELPFGYIKPVIKDNVVKGKYDPHNNTYYGNGSIEVSYNIGEVIDPRAISVSYERPEPNIKQNIWDIEKNNWKSGDFSSFEIEGADLSKYLDQGKVLRFKFELNGSQLQLPQISVKGSGI